MIIKRNQPESWKPWKNGGGLTREIAVYPASASTEDFLWRVSVAKIERPGPFSQFPNVRRRLMLLNGNGVLFQFADRSVMLTDSAQTMEFSGEDDLYCSPVDGACLVMNVMTRSDWVCKMHVAHDGSLPTTRELGRIIIVAEGAVRLTESANPPELLQAGEAALLGPGATLQVDISGERRPTLIELVFCRSSEPL